MSGLASNSAAFPAFIDPPYWILIAAAVASSYTSAMQALIAAHTSSAWSDVAVLPVPIAQIGS